MITLDIVSMQKLARWYHYLQMTIMRLQPLSSEISASSSLAFAWSLASSSLGCSDPNNSENYDVGLPEVLRERFLDFCFSSDSCSSSSLSSFVFTYAFESLAVSLEPRWPVNSIFHFIHSNHLNRVACGKENGFMHYSNVPRIVG